MVTLIAIPWQFNLFWGDNYDLIFNQKPIRALNLIPKGVDYLENEGIDYDGIKFYSVPASPYLRAPVAIAVNVDFLITHGQAYSYLDRDLGCKQLFLSAASARPKYHIFGHVHVSYFEELRKSL